MGQYNIDMRPATPEELIGYTTESFAAISKEVKTATCVVIYGSTGSGKTTLALLLAKQMTTENVKPINAGSQGGIDDIRAMIKRASMRTLQGGRRVFIIDEAHKITKAAMDALLVPLEDGDSKTTWFLCTNEPERLPKVLMRRALKIETPEWTAKRLLKLAKRVSKKTGRPIPKDLTIFDNPSDLLTYMQVPNKAAAENKKGNVAGAIFVLTGLLGEKPRGALYQFQYSTIMEISLACRARMGVTLGYEKPDPTLVKMLRDAEPTLVARIANACATALRDDTRPPMVLLDVLMCSAAAKFHFEE